MMMILDINNFKISTKERSIMNICKNCKYAPPWIARFLFSPDRWLCSYTEQVSEQINPQSGKREIEELNLCIRINPSGNCKYFLRKSGGSTT